MAEQVKIICRLTRPGIIDDFNYAKYLRKDKIFVSCILAEVRPLAPPGKWSIPGYIGRIKSWLAQGINNSLPEPQASIIKGIILGDSRGIPESYNTIFANLGLTHIIAVSGSHLVVMFAIILSLLLALGVKRQKTFWPAAIIIAGYVALVGAPASAVRSAIMALAALYAVTLGRLTGLKNILVFTAAIMLLANPFTLLDDVGFQLSFASVVGLGYLLPVLKRCFRNWPELWQVKEIILTTVSAQLATLPLILYYFGRLSVWSLPANLLILPIIPPLMILGLLDALAGAIVSLLGQVIGWLIWPLVQYWLIVSVWINSWPLSSVGLAGFGASALVFSYILLFWFLWLQSKKT
ncbi:MAG: ComEC/Rec2 family competence protein [Candidatus Buchananbacteria bacterium]